MAQSERGTRFRELYINSISIDSGYDGNSPQAPNLTITPAISGGRLINNIRLEAPAHTLSGLPLSDVLKYEISNTSGSFSVQGEITPLQSIDLADMGCDEKGKPIPHSLSQTA